MVSVAELLVMLVPGYAITVRSWGEYSASAWLEFESFTEVIMTFPLTLYYILQYILGNTSIPRSHPISRRHPWHGVPAST